MYVLSFIELISDYIQSLAINVYLLTLLSLGSAVASVLLAIWVVTAIPEDYFFDKKQAKPIVLKLPFYISLVLIVVKNLLGYCCFILGLLMLILPGQGILMMLVGLMLVNLPGKYRFERWLVLQHKVLLLVNRLREWRRKGVLIFGEGERYE